MGRSDVGSSPMALVQFGVLFSPSALRGRTVRTVGPTAPPFVCIASLVASRVRRTVTGR
jgi:hypothetical protein